MNTYSRLLVVIFIMVGTLVIVPIRHMGQTSRLYAQETGLGDLGGINWDEEETAKPDTALSDMNWDEESPSDSSGSGILSENWEDDTPRTDSAGKAAERAESIRRIEEKEQVVHVSGFILFLGYILGGILTAYITRNRSIAIKYPPEIMILFHTFWPLEWLLFPVIGRKVG